jgi:nucleolar complex protein 3
LSRNSLSSRNSPSIKTSSQGGPHVSKPKLTERYRIRPLTDSEKSAKVSKEVKQLRTFEQHLLSNYKAYIASLVSITKSARSETGDKSLSLVAVICAGSLLVAVPHFNFRTEILKLLVAQLSRRNPDETFIKSREALETLFQEDEDGNACMEALSILNKMIKAGDYHVHPSVLTPPC